MSFSKQRLLTDDAYLDASIREVMEVTRELDSRESDGIIVRLLWNTRTNATSVTVDDQKTGQFVEVKVLEGQSPREVFNHPYAFVS